MAVRPVDLHDFSKASTVVRSDSAVAYVLAGRRRSGDTNVSMDSRAEQVRSATPSTSS